MQVRNALLTAAFAGLAMLPVAQAMAQEAPMEGPVKTTALINAESKSETPLNPAMLKLDVDGHATPLDSVMAVNPSGVQVAILIDDGLRSGFDLQLKELGQFINSLPPGMQVLVGYMRNGTVMESTGFRTDHAAVAGALRVSLASPGIDASPYFCLSSFVKHWPSNERAARFVMMLTNGVDPYNGSTSILNQDSPYVQAAQDDAQRAGVAVYSIYFGEAGFRGRGTISGQDYLDQVAEATGGQSFYQGFGNPVDLQPYLKEFSRAIAESYNISFMANANNEKRDTLTHIKVKTSQQGIKIHAPKWSASGNGGVWQQRVEG